MTTLSALTTKLDTEQPRLDKLDRYWRGEQPTAFLSPKSVEALGNRLRSLTVNYPKLSVLSLVDRLRLTGFRIGGDPTNPPDAALWSLWRRNGMIEGQYEAMKDALAYGRGYVVVWVGPRGVQISVESPRQMTVRRDPATREIIDGVKRWKADGHGWATIYTGTEITTYKTRNTVGDDWALIPGSDWVQQGDSVANPLGVPPIGQILNRDRLLDFDGVSEMSGILDLTDALGKIMQDAMITSEDYARPRRWATGLEVTEDDEGNVVNPFGDDSKKVWTNEAPEGKFGQFAQADMSGFETMANLLITQIGAIKGLPTHYLGLQTDQPPSADAIRSAEASLVAHANTLLRMFGADFAWIAALVVAVRDGVDPYTVDVESVWANPETRTPAQAADAAAKLAGIGVPLETLLADELGYDPTRIADIMAKRRGESLEKAATDLSRLV
ncbi:hypothetical protein IWX63_001291 [Arthrobacter sp. CAN_A2]|uniref:phage portal protein n=1 Tax=Arthrobacter sp. CAN_A2 TaxID=2787718 RepID=UPI0018EF833D